MVKSMTAYARDSFDSNQYIINWELKTLNHRYLDVNVRLPDELKSVEMASRQLIQQQLGRGKVEIICKFEFKNSAVPSVKMSMPRVKEVIAACNEIEIEMGVGQAINPIDILSYPGVVTESGNKFEADEKLILQSLKNALIQLNREKEKEGERLKVFVLDRAERLQIILQTIRNRQPEVGLKVRQRLEKKLQTLSVNIDNERLQQEWVYIAQKMDIDEELDRLDSHLQELKDVFEREEAIGRRLDFLMQELNREANTLGSKSADVETTQATVDLKVLIEQIREQVQNIE